MNALEKQPNITTFEYEGKRTILFIPSFSIGLIAREVFKNVSPFQERNLYFLNYLKNPQTKLVAILTEGVEQTVFDYFFEHVQAAAIRKSKT